MSEISTPVTADHFRCLAERTTREDAFLRDLKTEARARNIPPIWISPEQASFIEILLMAARATEIVEIGTLTGYSAVWMAHALLSDGRVRTIEKSPRHADFVERWISKSDVAHKVEVYRGDAAEILPAFHADSADAALIDANKEGRPLFLREIMRIVRRGGLGMADSVFGFGRILDKSDTGASSMRAFNDIMSKETGLRSIIVPVGDEPWLGLKM